MGQGVGRGGRPRLSQGVTRLAPQEWSSGDHLWLVDVITPFGGGERAPAALAQTVPAGQKVKYWGVNDQGQRVIKVMETGRAGA